VREAAASRHRMRRNRDHQLRPVRPRRRRTTQPATSPAPAATAAVTTPQLRLGSCAAAARALPDRSRAAALACSAIRADFSRPPPG
jgi:hypothetical protein